MKRKMKLRMMMRIIILNNIFFFGYLFIFLMGYFYIFVVLDFEFWKKLNNFF